MLEMGVTFDAGSCTIWPVMERPLHTTPPYSRANASCFVGQYVTSFRPCCTRYITRSVLILSTVFRTQMEELSTTHALPTAARTPLTL